MVTTATENGPFAPLAGQSYISMITFRKTGVPVSTPIWFALETGRLYGYSTADAGKVKRLRKNPRVQVAPCTSRGVLLGPYIEAQGRLLSPTEGVHANAALTGKYGLPKRLMDIFSRFRSTPRIFFEITPAAHLVETPRAAEAKVALGLPASSPGGHGLPGERRQ